MVVDAIEQARDVYGKFKGQPFRQFQRETIEAIVNSSKRVVVVRAVTGAGKSVVGMGPTKTLAKSAQWASKEWPQFGGVLALTPGNPRRTEKLLSLQPVS